MVSILAVREQQEAERRRERLVAARKIASAVSVSRAQLYAAGKQVQQQRVRQDVEERWRQSKLQQSVELERQVRANSAKMGDGMIEAAAHTTALHRTAVEEASAWDAEHELENARHRLATARVHVEQRQRERPAEERRERIANLAKSTEKQRKRAAPVPVAVACGGDRAVADMWPMNPSNDAMLLPRPADPWAPRVLFAAGGGAFPETRAISAMEAAEQLPRIPVEVEVQRAEAMAEEQSRLAARRAALVHQQELMAAEQQQQQKDELRNRRAEAAVTYRHPREEDEELAMEGPLTKAPTPFTAAAHGGHPSVSAAHHPATAMQRSRAAAAKADEAFEAEFLRPPRVLLHDERGGEPLRPLLPMDALLRPAELMDLFGTTTVVLPTHDCCVVPVTMESASAEVAEANPLSPSFTSPTATKVETEQPMRSTDDAAEAPTTPALDVMDIPVPRTPMENVATEENVAAITEAVLAVQPEVSAPLVAPPVHSLCAPTPATEAVVNVSLSSSSGDDDDPNPPCLAESSCLTTTSSTSTSAWSGDLLAGNAAAELSSSFSTSTTGFSGTDSSSGGSLPMTRQMPTMTADQLRLALIHLRNRMKVAQMT